MDEKWCDCGCQNKGSVELGHIIDAYEEVHDAWENTLTEHDRYVIGSYIEKLVERFKDEEGGDMKPSICQKLSINEICGVDVFPYIKCKGDKIDIIDKGNVD